MRFFYLFILSLLLSCGYPDIDSVPNFKNINLSKEESIDLCKLTNADKKSLSDCLAKIKQ